jgi:pyruvate dehydrogenase E2 component (dihydrolipoamide acetyltransferase)
MKTFTLPDLGEGLQEAEIVTWHVELGDDVVADQPIVSVETDKAVVEIPSPYNGSVKALHAGAGDVVKIGAPLIDFEESVVTDSGVIVGVLPDQAASVDDESTAQPTVARKVKAAPAVRAMARKLGIDLGAVDGSGPDGAVTATDVERAAKVLASLEPAEPLRGVRRAMARKMAQSHAEVVPTTVNDEADIDAWPEGTDISVRLIRAIAAACEAQPALNAWYDNSTESRRLLSRVDLGIAVHTEDGLFVPVMRDVGNRDAGDLRSGLAAMRKDVEARDIPPDELRGATITLSNFGVFGAGRHAALVVMPPQVAIVGCGRVEPRVVAVDGACAVRRIMPLSLTFDHRVVNGGEASGFLAAMIADLRRAE